MPLINGMFFIKNLLCSVFKDKDHEKSPVSNLILATQWS